MFATHSGACRRLQIGVAFITLLIVQPVFVLAAAPRLYGLPTYQSPVRADPDDLLLLPGEGLSSSDEVVYGSLRNSTRGCGHPPMSSVPGNPTESLGFAEIVNSTDVPHTLTVRLPAEISKDDAYALWVVNPQGEWSNCVKINDARPLWMSPDYAYSTDSVANLPRVLKVVGRNLQPTAQSKTQVRLIGPRTYTLTAVNASASLSRHVAQVALPTPMQPGRYSVQVSRDGVSWIELLAEQGGRARTLTVLPDPPSVPTVEVHDYDCEADDDTSCVVNAVAAAGDTRRFPNGATVVFAARTYELSDPGTWSPGGNSSSKHVDFEGIWIPKHVNLEGQGIGKTIVVRGKHWVTPKYARPGRTVPIASLFNLQGNNTVQGFTFSDENVYTPASEGTNAALALGVDARYARNIGLRDSRLSQVIITRNEFRVPFTGIQGQGLPINHLFITYNTVAAYQNGLYINRWGSTEADNPFDMTDSVISHNTFYASSFDTVIASQLGGGTRLDFSDNTADGTSGRYLYNATDTKGFRAAFFWNLSVNSELKLISSNHILCAGDKPGDGEAIVLDGADETAYGGFERAALVSAVTSVGAQGTAVTVNSKPLTGPLGFIGQWLQVVQGTGLGQLRKVTAYESDAETATFTVSPGFDVLPQPGSAVTVGLQNWQTYILDNVVDQSTGTCVNGPKAAPTAGTISFYAQTADSVIDGNRQVATTGISLAHQYILYPGKAAFLMLQSSNEVRDNEIDRATAFGGSKGVSGIRTFYVASREPRAVPPPPVLDFGTVIAGNRLNEAEGVNGAIEFEDAGPVGFLNSRGGCAASWKIGAVPLVFHNELLNTRGIGINSRESPQHPPSCRGSARDSVVWHATLYGNSCRGTSSWLTDSGVATQVVCRADGQNSCECDAEAALRAR